MYFAEETEGRITGLYSDDNGNVPTGAIKISDELFDEIGANQRGMGVYCVVSGAVVLNQPLIDMQKKEFEDAQYQRDRVAEYPEIQDQLDMIFHDLESGTQLWQEKIRTIKTKYPKVK